MNQTPPIFTAHLFQELDNHLISLLKSLSPADWEKPTLAKLWCVKDIAAHLLDGNIRGLSVGRDAYFGEKPEKKESYQDLVSFLNRLNADWVKAMRRLSPAVLIELLEITGNQYNSYLQSLPAFEKAVFSVAWAGEDESANWFHIAREYTEKWHHQQQIRFALGQDKVLYHKQLYYPYLDTSMRALPHHYRNISANEGDTIKFVLRCEGGGEWFLNRQKGYWQLLKENQGNVVCEIEMNGEIAWRIFTKGIAKTEAENHSKIQGNVAFAKIFFDMLAVMA